MPPDAAAVSRALKLAKAFSEQVGFGPTAANHLAMVIEEWVANIVEHGGPQTRAIVIRLSVSKAAVHLAISDGGRAFDPRAARFSGPNHDRGGGAGLAMILSLCRITSYSRRAGRNRLLLEMPLIW